jgi:hypothetical protein
MPMPAATTRDDLIAVTLKEWAKLDALIDTVPEAVARHPFEDHTSIKDVIAHRAHWIGLFFQWLDEGEQAQMPDHGVKWSELKPYNAGLRETYRPLSWAEARDRLSAAHARLLRWMEDTDEATMYGGPMPGGNGKWTAGRFAEAAGPSHYRSAAKYVRACLRQARDLSLM